jgi:phenylacetate-CoA ligase
METIYARAPVWVQNAMVTAKGWQLRRRRSSDRLIREQHRFLQQSQRWTPAQFDEYQRARLRELLATAFRDVPHYRALAVGLGVTPADFVGVEDLRRLPILKKRELRGNEAAFMNETIDSTRGTNFFTSGTTGTPITLFETTESWSKRWAFVVRLREWAGVPQPLHPHRAQFTGRAIVPGFGDGVYWRRNRADNSLLLSVYHIGPHSAAAYVRAIQRYKPTLVDGYPSSMLTLLRCAPPGSLKLPSLSAVITTSEPLSAEMRAEIQDGFGARVHDQYGATEPSCFWGECEHGVMHISPEYGISEILDADDNPVGPGERGRVVVTSFLNHAMPLIRYEVGDAAIRGPDTPCECGRTMPRVETVTGRLEDYFWVPQRGYVMRLDAAFKGLSCIIEAQAIQERLDLVRICVVPADGFNDMLAGRLEANFREKLGPGVEVIVERVPEIPRGANGKFKWLVSHVRDQYPDARMVESS